MVLSLILACVIIGSSGQLLLKMGMDRVGEFAFSAHNIWPIALKIITSPFVLLGIVCYALSLIVWLLVLSRAEVGYAYPLLSIGYVLTAILAYFLFGESLSFIRLFGIGMIMIGVFCITR